MDAQEPNERLWSAIMRLIYFCLFCIIALMLYIPLEKQIDDFLNRPKLNKRTLKELSAQRASNYTSQADLVENGIHLQTGLIYDTHFQLVNSACTSCHSAKLIIQNKADRTGWKQMINWMYETQGLPKIDSENERKILDYLSKNYAPKEVGRRQNLVVAEEAWYKLEL